MPNDLLDLTITTETVEVRPTRFTVGGRRFDDDVNPDPDMVVAEMHEHVMRQLPGFVG